MLGRPSLVACDLDEFLPAHDRRATGLLELIPRSSENWQLGVDRGNDDAYIVAVDRLHERGDVTVIGASREPHRQVRIAGGSTQRRVVLTDQDLPPQVEGLKLGSKSAQERYPAAGAGEHDVHVD